VKLILTSDVPGVGAPGDVVEVKDGYGRNYLLPRGVAVTWSKGGEKQVTQIKRARAARGVRDLAHAQEIKAFLEGAPVRLEAKAGSGGRLFGSIGGADVAQAVRAAGGPEIDRRKVSIGTPHSASVALAPEVSATVTLEVVAG
jgi:large subunit ribosomal protein L9